MSTSTYTYNNNYDCESVVAKFEFYFYTSYFLPAWYAIISFGLVKRSVNSNKTENAAYIVAYNCPNYLLMPYLLIFSPQNSPSSQFQFYAKNENVWIFFCL